MKNTNTTAIEKDLLEIVKMAEQRKTLEEKLSKHQETIKAEIARLNGVIEKAQAEKAEFVKMISGAGISTGKGRPVGSKNKAKTPPVATPEQNAEKAQVLGVLTGNVADIPNIETVPAQSVAA